MSFLKRWKRVWGMNRWESLTKLLLHLLRENKHKSIVFDLLIGRLVGWRAGWLTGFFCYVNPIWSTNFMYLYRMEEGVRIQTPAYTNAAAAVDLQAATANTSHPFTVI